MTAGFVGVGRTGDELRSSGGEKLLGDYWELCIGLLTRAKNFALVFNISEPEQRPMLCLNKN